MWGDGVPSADSLLFLADARFPTTRRPLVCHFPPLVCHFGERQHESECGVCVVEGVRQLALGQSVSRCQPPRGQARANLAACLLGVEGVEYIIP